MEGRFEKLQHNQEITPDATRYMLITHKPACNNKLVSGFKYFAIHIRKQ